MRPDDVIEYFKSRCNLKQSDFQQLAEGIQIGGMIVVGGGPMNVKALLPVMSKAGRLGAVSSLQELDPKKINVRQTITFDLAAVAQLIMLAKNEVFHATADQCLSHMQKMFEEGYETEIALASLRELVDAVPRM